MKNKTVLITGSSRGIGWAIAQRFAAAGANIILNSRSKIDDDQITIITAMGVKCMGISADVSDEKQVSVMMEEIKNQTDGIDVLVNNAGITNDKLMIRMTTTDFESCLKVNLTGTFNVTQPIFRMMLKKRQGCIINMASVIGLMGNIGQANYAASKAGIIGFTKSIAKEGAARNVRVNAIAPGMIETEMTAVLSEEVQQQILANIPLKRLGQAGEIADTALFLAQNQYITGQTITVDGGLVMQGGM